MNTETITVIQAAVKTGFTLWLKPALPTWEDCDTDYAVTIRMGADFDGKGGIGCVVINTKNATCFHDLWEQLRTLLGEEDDVLDEGEVIWE